MKGIFKKGIIASTIQDIVIVILVLTLLYALFQIFGITFTDLTDILGNGITDFLGLGL